ncbi:MAG: ATPase AAA [Candidatus Sericytochromatia bacterium]|nr:MAG: ATPase AAA [Candidatus Sericytochromatia bacterium]
MGVLQKTLERGKNSEGKIMKQLPIGISSFEKIRGGDYYYVDKSIFIEKLVRNGTYYFLSRPRRFGKSLLVDTLKQAFLGRKELFEGLYLEKNWDWGKKYPVIHIDFGGGVIKDKEELKQVLIKQLEEHYILYGLKILENKNTYNFLFRDLIISLYKKYNQSVVVLVDEYDKPILDRIEDREKAIEIREVLKDFYSVLKPLDAYLKFVFLTGVSRFSKVSIFSGLNQIQDITLSPKFSTICGYTQEEFEEVFKDRLLDVDIEEIKKWYNGYNWLGDKVYNPFDILLFLDEKLYRPYWFETGTPTFLVKLFHKERYYLPELENLEVGEELLSNIDIDFIHPENLLFQTGYLAIKERYQLGIKNYYLLSYPNIEVRISLNDAFLNYITNTLEKDRVEIGIIRVLESNNLDRLKELLYSFFSSIQMDWYRRNEIDKYEGFYASVVYALLNGSGLEVITEDATNRGRIDLTVIYKDRVYIIEFKVIEKEEGLSLKQIKERRYYEKYQGKYREIYLIGIEFSKEKRNIVHYEWEKL